jgi:hypothetical protein
LLQLLHVLVLLLLLVLHPCQAGAGQQRQQLCQQLSCGCNGTPMSLSLLRWLLLLLLRWLLRQWRRLRWLHWLLLLLLRRRRLQWLLLLWRRLQRLLQVVQVLPLLQSCRWWWPQYGWHDLQCQLGPCVCCW